MWRLLGNRIFIVFLLTFLLVVGVGLSAGENIVLAQIQGVVSTVISPLQKVFYVSAGWIEGNVAFLGEMNTLRDKNRELNEKVTMLEQEKQKYSEMVNENKRLREVLGLKEQYNQFEFIGANIIAKDPGNWFYVFTADRGSKDGVSNNQPVVTSNRLIGRVLQTGFNSSKIISIIDSDSSVHGRLSRTREYVVIRGDLTLREQGLCKMEFIPLEADIEVGDIVETSGLGEIYPKGIIIGKIKEIRQSSRDINRYAIIEPAVDFKRLEEVFIWKTKEEK